VTGGLLLAERVMFALGEHVGRQVAHDVVYECAMQSVETNQAFLQQLQRDARVTAYLSPAEITKLLDPTQYVGLAAVFVDRVLARVPI
jgi:adenylosuccinate lyase